MIDLGLIINIIIAVVISKIIIVSLEELGSKLKR